MEWTFTNLIIQTVAGLIGASLAAAAAHEHRFGFWRHALVGLASGALGGLTLQQYASTVVTASGSLNEPTQVRYCIPSPDRCRDRRDRDDGGRLHYQRALEAKMIDRDRISADLLNPLFRYN